jgi:inositol oxygenase
MFKDQFYLPAEGLAMIRYHSFYPWHRHREGAYAHLTNDKDAQVPESVRAFNSYDLYSTGNEHCDVESLKPYYQKLIGKFFSEVLDW